MLRVLAAVFALVAVACMTLAIVGMVTGRPGDRAGLVLRIGRGPVLRDRGRAEHRGALSLRGVCLRPQPHGP